MHLIYTNWAVFIVFCYLWLPFMIIPVYAALERIPASLIEASQDLGGRTWRTTRSVLLPLALPGIVAGSIFTFSLTLGDYITPLLVGGTSANFIGNVIYSNIGIANNVPFAAAMALVPIVDHGPLPARRAGARRVRGGLRMESPWLRVGAAGLGRAGAGVPVHPDRADRAVRVQPLEHRELADRGLLAALVLRGLARPAGAQRVPAVGPGRAGRDRAGPAARLGRRLRAAQFRFFGREAISFLLVLPLALPGIITGIALNSFFSFTGIQLGTITIVIGHTTFCIVVVFNNLIARLRRIPGSLAEASQDLGARGWQTLRYVTLPLTATALVSGALLAFALSFDEVIVTVFTAGAQNTLPLWIFGAIRLGQQLPEVNAVVTVVILLTLIPVILAARVAGAGALSRTARNVPVS